MLLLRASSQNEGGGDDLAGITGRDGGGNSVAHGAVLLAFVDAVVRHDDAALAAARDFVLAAVGLPGLITAASVTGNFQRMVRIADGTGIPLDQPVLMATQDLREQLDLQRFGSAGNTRGLGWLRRALFRRLAPRVRRRIARRRRAGALPPGAPS